MTPTPPVAARPRGVPALVALASVAGLLSSPGTQAAPPVTAFQLERFEPLYAPELNLLSVMTSDVLGHLSPAVSLLAHVSSGALVVEEDRGDGTGWRDASSVDYSTRLEFAAGLGISRWLDLGLVVPLTVYQEGSVLSGPTDESAVGGVALQDPRVIVRFRPLRPRWAGGLGIAVAFTTYVPVGATTRLGSSRAARLEPRLVVDWRHEIGVKIAANVALEATTDEASAVLAPYWLKWAVGVAAPLGVEGLQLTATAFGRAGFGPATASAYDGLNTGAIEVEGDLRYRHGPSGLFVAAGGGTGVTDAIGAPRWRATFTLGWSSDQADDDEDGVPNRDDLCADLEEDLDGVPDEDGCPEDDNDDDRIPDEADLCPLDPEDIDGFEDDDGCPDEDNDGDRIPDALDKCPLRPEDRDGSQDSDGCPEPDDDGDGVPDATDQCAHSKEDLDGFEDEDGCLDPDDDDDGIFDGVDLCPRQAEVHNGIADDDGCPDDEHDLAVLTRRSIWLRGRVDFEPGTAVLTPEARSTVRAAAVLLIGHPEVGDVVVEGHTDDRGHERDLLVLSQQRAEATRQLLIEVGVGEDRLEARGFGGSLPMDTNETQAGRDANQRIELRFERPVKRGPAAQAPPTTPVPDGEDGP